MNTQTTFSVSEARSKIFNIIRMVQKPGAYFTFTEKGRPAAVLLSAEEYESLIETMEVLSDPRALKSIKEAEEAYEKGDYVTLDEFKKELRTKK